VSGSIAKSSDFFLLEESLSLFATADYTEAEIVEMQNARNHIELEFNDMRSDIDIKDYFTQLATSSSAGELSQSAQSILNQIDQTFISQYFHDLQNPAYPAGTATIWWPDVEDTFFNLQPLYNNLYFAETTNWDNYLEQFFY
jgi:hypothetical protein